MPTVTGLPAHTPFSLSASGFNRLRDSNGAASANASGNLDTDYSVDGGLAKVDLNINQKIFKRQYFFGKHTGLVVRNSQTITQEFWRPADLRSARSLKARVNLSRSFGDVQRCGFFKQLLNGLKRQIAPVRVLASRTTVFRSGSARRNPTAGLQAYFA